MFTACSHCHECHCHSSRMVSSCPDMHPSCTFPSPGFALFSKTLHSLQLPRVAALKHLVRAKTSLTSDSLGRQIDRAHLFTHLLSQLLMYFPRTYALALSPTRVPALVFCLDYPLPAPAPYTINHSCRHRRSVLYVPTPCSALAHF